VRHATTPAPFAERARTLVDDAVRVARETGARPVISRTVQGQRAVLETLLELNSELPRPPPASTVLEAVRAGAGARDSSAAAAAFAEPLGAWARENVPPELLPKVARRLCEKLGATYVKLGQFVASSPTLFPEAYVREFEKTLDDVPAAPFDRIRAVVEAELGGPIEATYASFDPTPVAAASVAQVHRARLRPELGGADVAVKVLRPGVDDLLRADLGFLEVAGRAAEAVAPAFGRLSLANVVSDLRATMLDELDLVKEAANLVAFRAWVDSAGLGDVATCPRTYPAASSKRVLTMDFLEGVALTDVAALTALYGDEAQAERTLISALNTWTLSVLSCDFFHADMHAGNLLALADGRVAFIDFGIVGRVPPSIWQAVQDTGTAFAAQDYRGLAEALVAMGAAESVDVDAFAADLEGLVASLEAVDPSVVATEGEDGLLTAQIAVDDAQITDVLLKLVETAERNGVKLPREFGLLVKQALYFDRYTKILAPEMDVLRDGRLEINADRDGAISA
jgi:aarF domain-containing kinase